MQELIREIRETAPDAVIKPMEPLANYTSFRIGGPAELYLRPGTMADVPALIRLIRERELPLHILGGGSNLLVSDSGVAGVVLHLAGGGVTRTGDAGLRADAGFAKAAAAVYAWRAGLSGLEFLHGIPGLLGGGVMMNAGAYGGEISQVTGSVTVCDREGRVFSLGKEALDFGYRHSVFADHRDWTVLSVDLELHPGDPAEIRACMDDLMRRRREKQPLEYPSAGSTFRRPAGYFAGKLIEDSGLKGCAVGGACVSEKHAGFVINRGGATCEDVRRLIDHIRETVLHQFGVELVCEVEMW